MARVKELEKTLDATKDELLQARSRSETMTSPNVYWRAKTRVWTLI